MDLTSIPELFTSLDTESNPPQNVAIVGAGIAGLTLATKLLEKNPDYKITVFCSDDDVALGGSSNDQGAIYPLLQANKSVIANFYADAYQYACTYYRDTLPNDSQPNKNDVPHKWCGVLQQAINDNLQTKFKTISQLWPDLAQFFSPDESSQISHLELPYPSLFYKHGGWLNPKRYCQWLKKQLLATNKVTFRFNSQVHSIEKKLKTSIFYEWQVCLETNEQATSSGFDQVVVAAGVDTIKLSACSELPITPVLGQVSKASSESSLSPLKTVLCHKGYITPADENIQSFGATFEKGATRAEVTDSANQVNVEQIQKVYPHQTWSKALSVKDIDGANAAYRATTSDHLPLAGEIVHWDWVANYIDKNNGQYKRQDKIQQHIPNDYAGLYVLTGLGARGITSAPILAEILSSQMTGLPSKIADSTRISVSPLRFKIREYKRKKQIPR